MDESHQVVVPPSFQDLFREPGRTKLTQPWPTVLTRYEWCEDLAQALCPQARDQVWALNVTAADVVQRMAPVLASPEVGLAPEEAQWVSHRLVELIEQGLGPT